MNKVVSSVLLISVCFQTFVTKALAQNDNTDSSVAAIRKGQLIVKAKRGDNIVIEQLSHEFLFGCAISDDLVNGSLSPNDLTQYKQKFLENFNAAVPENALKWYTTEPEKNKISYALIDSILNWTERNQIPVRGHNIFWGVPQYVQPWIKQLNDDELREKIKSRAIEVTSRFKGKFIEYDLNNEMIDSNYYADRLGAGITKQMTEWALQGDPDAKFFLNEFDITTGAKLPGYMALIRRLLQQGVPVSGIGIQGHMHSKTFDRAALTKALDSLSIFHLPIRITEFNMPGAKSIYMWQKNRQMTPEEEALRAKEVVDFYKICFAHPAITGILMWGFWEGSNWIPASSLYKRDWTPTPAAKAYQNLVFTQWWTKESGIAGKKGVYTTKAFYGNYKVTVNGISKNVYLAKEKGAVTVDFNR